MLAIAFAWRSWNRHQTHVQCQWSVKYQSTLLKQVQDTRTAISQIFVNAHETGSRHIRTAISQISINQSINQSNQPISQSMNQSINQILARAQEVFCACVHACVHVCVCVCVHVFIWMCMHVYMCVHTCVSVCKWGNKLVSNSKCIAYYHYMSQNNTRFDQIIKLKCVCYILVFINTNSTKQYLNLNIQHSLTWAEFSTHKKK